MTKHEAQVVRHKAQQRHLEQARQSKKTALEAIVGDPTLLAAAPKTPIELARLEGEIEETAQAALDDLQVNLNHETKKIIINRIDKRYQKTDRNIISCTPRLLEKEYT